MKIERSAASLSRKFAKNRRWVNILNKSDEDQPGGVDLSSYWKLDSATISVHGCTSPDNEKAQYDYTVTLSATEVIELLLTLKPDAIGSAVALIHRCQGEIEKRHRDVAMRIPEIVRQLTQGLYLAYEAEQQNTPAKTAK